MFFFFNDTATTEIYTLSLHDALPICQRHIRGDLMAARKSTGTIYRAPSNGYASAADLLAADDLPRSEEHTSELQSQSNLVCRLLLEKNHLFERVILSRSKPLTATSSW